MINVINLINVINSLTHWLHLSYDITSISSVDTQSSSHPILFIQSSSHPILFIQSSSHPILVRTVAVDCKQRPRPRPETSCIRLVASPSRSCLRFAAPDTLQRPYKAIHCPPRGRPAELLRVYFQEPSTCISNSAAAAAAAAWTLARLVHPASPRRRPRTLAPILPI
jgi:hypothetical protein